MLGEKSGNNIKIKYPHVGDSEFQKKITLKKEFNYPYKIQGKKKIASLEKLGKLCKNEDFSLAPHQELIKNFIHPNTSYNGLLLYHGMGTGKTCTAIGVCEQFRTLNKYNQNFNKIWIIASPNVQENFKRQLFDPEKLIKINGIWNLDTCVGALLLQELHNYDLQNMTKEMIVNKINKNINKSYIFIGYEKYANLIMSALSLSVNIKDTRKKEISINAKLNKEFGNSLLVIDEAHNIRFDGKSNDKKTAMAIKYLTKYVKKNKILLLTGTPMFNNPSEIIFLLDILRKNDKLSEIKKNEIFDKSGNLLKNKQGVEVGANKLLEKSNGYVSYVRGEDPYKFPFKIYPSDYNSEFSIFNYTYPTFQYNKKKIVEKIEFLDLYMNNMSEFQKNAYQSFKKKLYKGEKDQNKLDGEDEKNENDSAVGYKEFQEIIYSLNISYRGEDENSYLNGKGGLYSIISKNDRSKFNYINKENNIFNYDTIGEYSAKIKNILDIVMNSDGIILIYSQYKDSGLIPLALALEELGMNRINSQDNLFSNNGKKDNKGKIFQGKYSMITGDPLYSKNNYNEISVINRDENVNGNLCKVVLITQAGSEGIDFKNLRQVHIMEPWYNLNRIDQIAGRAIRNCSHKLLPLSKRNCQIFLHGTYIDETEEAIDLLLYRKCEEKSKKIGKVQRVLKSVSIDCIINENQKEFSNLNEALDKIELSTKDVINNFSVKDKPYSLVCDYQKECNYICNNKLNENDVEDISTFKQEHALKTQLNEKIKKLFLKKHVYKIDEIIKLFDENHSIEYIYMALNSLVKNKNEISNKFGKKGVIINVKDLYVFQPSEFDNSYTSLYDKNRLLTHKPIKLRVPKEINKKYKKEKSRSSNKTNTIENTNNLTVGKKNSLLISIEKCYNDGMSTNGKLKDKNKSFYENYSSIIEKLMELSTNIKISQNLKEKWLIEHLIENIPYKKELSFVNYLFASDFISEFAERCKKYYERNFIYDFLNGKILILVDIMDKNAEIGDKVHLYDSHIKLFYRANDEKNFRELKQSEKQEGQERINDILTENKVLQKDMSDYIVFTGYYEKNKENPNQLKIKKVQDMNKSKKNKGRVFINESPKNMIPPLNAIIKESIIVPKIFTKEQLGMVLEIVSKYFTTPGNIVYINKLQNAESNIKEL